jgi:hypothetical protein
LIPRQDGKYGKLNHLVFGHPTTTASLSINAYFLHHHLLKMDPREVAIQSAIADLASGVEKSQRAACKKWGVPRSSL